MKSFMMLACVFVLPGIAKAADHGPVFSYATPVNSQRELSFDTASLVEAVRGGRSLSTGSSIGYGITPHITINAFLPATFGSGSSLPESRVITGNEWSTAASWRFLHSVTSVGKRIESTASLGVVVPGPQQDSGVLASLHRAPGITGSLATGLASRSQYLWVGAGYARFAEALEDRRPDTFSWSGVYGYRPAKLRRGYDRWDYRGFAELTGEHTGNVLKRWRDILQTPSLSVYVTGLRRSLTVLKDSARERAEAHRGQWPALRQYSRQVGMTPTALEGARFTVSCLFIAD